MGRLQNLDWQIAEADGTVRRKEARRLAGTLNFLGHAAVVVVGSENSGGCTRRRCGCRLLPPTIETRIIYDCCRCQRGRECTNGVWQNLDSSHHQSMRARGVITAINTCYHFRMRGFVAWDAILGSITGKVAYVIGGITDGYPFVHQRRRLVFASCL